ncbi:MAG: hypothetical protein ACI83Q_000746 [Colwellia polaris]|jgi:hypothetical protein
MVKASWKEITYFQVKILAKLNLDLEKFMHGIAPVDTETFPECTFPRIELLIQIQYFKTSYLEVTFLVTFRSRSDICSTFSLKLWNSDSVTNSSSCLSSS